MFLENFSLPIRVALLGTLGFSAWLIAFVRIFFHSADIGSTDHIVMVLLALLNGVFFIINTVAQLRFMLRHKMQWILNNRDIICWVTLLVAYVSTCVIQIIWRPDVLDVFLLSFLIVIHSIHTIRFTAVISVFALVISSVVYGWLYGGEAGFYVAAFVMIQKLVLWGLGLGVLRELLETNKLKVSTAKLTIAQARLEESSRSEERRKIRQDLHDKMGHELAAMNINLQILEHKYPNKAEEEKLALEQAQASCQRLFSTLGEVVGELRKQTNEHFYDQLRSVIDKVPKLEIHLECNSDIRIQDDVVADNLLCCIQEGITNILKHSHATKAWVTLFSDDEQLKVIIRDNGRAIAGAKVGNGLNGIYGRMKNIGGDAVTGNSEQGGFKLSLNLPKSVLI
ncbi:MAG: histidine kinase [Oleibacter sp.]|nr:histidine kinase [Thalassolituus sp.]